MTVTATPSLQQQCLRDLNLLRSTNNLPELDEIPKGRPAHATDCPVARALRDLGEVVVVGRDGVLAWSGEERDAGNARRIPLSPALRKLVVRFDHGEFQELAE